MVRGAIFLLADTVPFLKFPPLIKNANSSTQLGVADATSVPDSDLVPVQLVYPDRVGETYTVRPNPDHRWHYLSEQTPREVLLIKCFDSKVDGRARRVPHSAFVDEANAGESPRESIEVRALVFHPDDVE